VVSVCLCVYVCVSVYVYVYVCLQGAFTRLDPSGTFRNAVKSRIPVGRLGEIPEFSNLACYLVSDYSSWMTGTVSPYALCLSVCLTVSVSVFVCLYSLEG